jgi:single stranded DNA-binding protein
VGSLASHDYRGGEERTEFHRLVFWEKLAEIAAAHLQAGSLVAIDGRLKTHEWESEGARRWMTEVIVNRLNSSDQSRRAQNRFRKAASQLI